MKNKFRSKPFGGATGGWGSVKSLGVILARENVMLTAPMELMKQNKPDGFACVSCAWAKPERPHLFEFCENGAKATAWEITTRKCGADFFAAHSVAELRQWPDYDLEQSGRLLTPMRIQRGEDHYKSVSWDEAFAEIGRKLGSFEPDSAVFYASGRASLETSYAYALFARLYGTNNLPDSSNMCHETTSVALPKSIGVPVGTVTLDDFKHTDLILFFGHNTGSNSPRMLHELQDARRRGVEIITFNPLRERGHEAFANPQSPADMLILKPTQISTQYHQLRIGGDLAALAGMCKAILAFDEDTGDIIDRSFIGEHTHGFENLKDSLDRWNWEDICDLSGLSREAIEAAASIYARAPSTMACYGMGLTQHRNGVATIQMLMNLLLLKGNIGRKGTGICPVRGHSNVQGQRTVGITEKPELVPLDQLAAQFSFSPPRNKGLNTIEACEAVLSGKVNAMFQLGGNLVRAVPDRDRIEPAWSKIPLTVCISTKLNRSHLIHGDVSFILPCLGRTEIDNQASGAQAVSVEDSTAFIHGSIGKHKPAGSDLMSELAIIAGIAKATLSGDAGPDWEAWTGDYRLVRAAISETYPEMFQDFEARMWTPGGFPRPIKARHRIWATQTRKANFLAPKDLCEDPDMPDSNASLRMMTLRSNDQFNTTIYGYDDRLRGISGSRMVILMNESDMRRFNLCEGNAVEIKTCSVDGISRNMSGFRVTCYNIPEGCCATYYPEANSLLPLSHYAAGSFTPAAKSIPVRIRKTSEIWENVRETEFSRVI